MMLAPIERELIEDYLDLVLIYSQPQASISEDALIDLWTLRTWIESLDLPIDIREKLAIANELVSGHPTLHHSLMRAKDAYVQGMDSNPTC